MESEKHKYYYTVSIAGQSALSGYGHTTLPGPTAEQCRIKANYVLNSMLGIYLGEQFSIEKTLYDPLRYMICAIGKQDIHEIGIIQFSMDPPQHTVSMNWRGDATQRRAKALDIVLERVGEDAAIAFGYEPPAPKHPANESMPGAPVPPPSPAPDTLELQSFPELGITMHAKVLSSHVHIVITGPGSLLLKAAELARVISS